MPTINQLVRKGRKTGTTKSTVPALQKGFNSKLDNKDMIIDNLHLELKKQMEKKYKWWIDY